MNRKIQKKRSQSAGRKQGPDKFSKSEAEKIHELLQDRGWNNDTFYLKFREYNKQWETPIPNTNYNFKFRFGPEHFYTYYKLKGNRSRLQPEYLEAFAKTFKMSLEQFCNHIGRSNTNRNNKENIIIAGAAEFNNWGWTYEKLLKEFIKMDYDTIPLLQDNHFLEGTYNQWADVFKDNPETWRMLVKENNEICGYWHIAPLENIYYEKAKNGSLLDCHITRDIVQEFSVCNEHNIYFIQICLKDKYRNPSNIIKLIYSIFDTFKKLAEYKIYIREITANAVTDEGIKLCKALGMKEICSHASDKGKIFSGTIDSAINGHLIHYSQKQELKNIYNNKYKYLNYGNRLAINEIIEFIKSDKIIIRNDETEAEVESTWRLGMKAYGDANWTLEQITNCWKAFPKGLQSAYIADNLNISTASIGLWPVTKEFAADLENENATEDDLDNNVIKSALNDPIKYWYFSGVEVDRKNSKKIPKLFSIGIRNIFNSVRLDYPIYVLTYAFSKEGKQILDNFGFYCIKNNTSKGGWSLYKIEIVSNFESILENRDM